ncbi:MAG: DUF5916 domain-containing protein [Acidobacteria bacterium]|nr:DUF5916 domain-containing protein [Acidobacteriota bacterium]
MSRDLHQLVPALVAIFTLAVPGAVAAADSPPPTMVLRFLDNPPKIDGRLDAGEWPAEPLPTGEWVSYNPLYGERLPHQTTVWVGYDKRYFYFAFRCSDPDPSKIKTTIARRDNMFNDDWVGLKLDAMGNGQTSYDMFVNPSGVQGDILTSAAKGENSSVDWIWDSAAKLTPDGYTVEIRVPVQSLRFKSGADVPMRVLFWRRISRLGMSVSWPDLPPGKSAFEREATMMVHDLAWPGVREVMPAVTESVNQTRTAPDQWSAADGTTNIGVSAKLGITSAVTLDGTINPDFSQVESDSFQVQVNQRYPVFFSEKRPFFMEGMGVFEVSGTGGDGNMATAVHTRRIADPLFGVKLSGTVGRVTFGTISASDDAAGRLDPQFEGKRKLFNIVRATYSLAPSSYLGAIVTETDFAGGNNRVAGGDMSLRIGSHQQINATVLRSSSTDPGAGASSRTGAMAQASYAYDSKRVGFATQVEHYDRDFQMDTAFYNRTGITGGWMYGGLNFYPDKTRTPWLKKINPFVFLQYVRDRVQAGHDNLQVFAIRSNFTRNGSLRADVIHIQEAWAHREFDQRSFRLQGNLQMTNWLYLSGQVRAGNGLYYDPVAPFVGPSAMQSVTVLLQPSARFAQNVSVQRVTLDRPGGAGRVYDARVVNTKTTYQFSARFAVRGIVQYDSGDRRVLGDFMSSYEVRPGTVFYAGYGTLFEKRDYREQAWIPGEGSYLTTSRGLFIKASYLHRF